MKTIEANVYMLPVSENVIISESNCKGLVYKCGQNLSIFDNLFQQLEKGVPQHLYITTDEEIKEGDWCLNVNTKEVYKKVCYGTEKDFIRKIIATTDTSLTTECETKFDCIHGCDGGYNPEMGHPCIGKPLLQIPQSFIEDYCKAGGIDKVLVEVEPFRELEWEDIMEKQHYKPKLNSDNTIIIHPIEEKMYNRDEVIELMKKAIKQGDDWRCELDRIALGFSKENPDVISEQLLNPIKWIEKNL